MPPRRVKANSLERSGSKEQCPMCKSKIAVDTPSVSCEICEAWFCLKCSKVPQSVYKLLVEEGTDANICVYVCVGCKTSLPVLSNINKTVNEIKQSTCERFDNLESKVSDLEGNMNKLVTKEEASQMKNEVKDEVIRDFETIVDTKLKEREELTKRENNLIFWGVPECDSENIEERRDFDSHFISDICIELGINEPKISQILRLGKRQSGQSTIKPRGILAKFVEKSQKRDILKKSAKLKNPSNKDLKKVSISRDLTRAQREEDISKRGSIRAEFDRRVQAGETDIILRGRRILKKKVDSGGGSASVEGEPVAGSTALGPF